MSVVPVCCGFYVLLWQMTTQAAWCNSWVFQGSCGHIQQFDSQPADEKYAIKCLNVDVIPFTSLMLCHSVHIKHMQRIFGYTSACGNRLLHFFICYKTKLPENHCTRELTTANMSPPRTRGESNQPYFCPDNFDRCPVGKHSVSTLQFKLSSRDLDKINTDKTRWGKILPLLMWYLKIHK